MVDRAGFEPSLSATRINDIEETIEGFRNFLSVKKLLAPKVVRGHINAIRRFLYAYDGIVSAKTIEAHLKAIKEHWKIKTYANHLGSMKRFVRDYLGKDWVDSYEFPRLEEVPIIVPTKKELREFFYALPFSVRTKTNAWEKRPTYRALFLLLASSGLRLGEALSLTKANILLKDRMLIPRVHETSSTKSSWVTFYNRETEERLTWLDRIGEKDRIFPTYWNVYNAFQKAREATGLDITPQRLRDWFCEEMGNLGISDRYIDAFCGRVPKSVLAKHYTDYSPKKLKRIYDKANLKVLS